MKFIRRFSLLIFAPILLVAHTFPNADSSGIKKKTWVSRSLFISVGSGAPNIDRYLGKEPDKRINPTVYSSRSYGIPFFLKLELPLSTHFGFNFNLARTSTNYLYDSKSGAVNMDWSVLTANFRLNYHFLYDKAIDVFVGSGLGLRNERYKYHLPNGQLAVVKVESPFLIGFEATVGLRYNLLRPFGIYAEAGFARTLLQAGFYLNPMALRK